MKKLISILLVICMCATIGINFISCDTENTQDEGTTTDNKVNNSEETTTKGPSSEEKTTDESTSEDTTTEDTTHTQLTENEWYALADPALYTNFTVIATQVDKYFKTVSETRVVDGYVYVSYTLYDWNSDKTYTNSGKNSIENVEKATLLPDMKDFSKIEYDAANGVYKYIEPIEVIDNSNPDNPLTITFTKYEWTINDGRIHKIYSEFWYLDSHDGRIEASQTAEYLNYGTTVAPNMPDNPSNPGGSVEPSITEEIWEEAFSLDASYLQVNANAYMGESLIMRAASNRAQDVIQIIDCDFGGNRMAIDYMEKVDGGWYYYNDCTESIDIDAERVYKKWFQTPEDCHGDDEFENTKNSPKNMISMFADKFDSFSYNEDKGGYFASSIDSTYNNVLVIFEGEKLQKITYSEDEYVYEFEFAFGEFNIFLPEATEVER